MITGYNSLVKVCSKCKVEKPLDEFTSGGKKPWCKDCVREYNRSYREVNRDHLLRQMALYQNNNNKERLLAQKALYRETNRELINEQATRYRETHREEINAREREYYRNNKEKFYINNAKRKAALLGVETDGTSRSDVWEKSGGVCHLCYRVLDPNESWHVDHIVPLRPESGLPGTDTLDNKAAACSSCNSRKRNRLLPSGAFVCS